VAQVRQRRAFGGEGNRKDPPKKRKAAVKPTRETSDLSLDELFRNYLQRQVDAEARWPSPREPQSAVIPHDPGQLLPTDPGLAWDNAVAVLAHLAPGPLPSLAAPPSWPALLRKKDQESTAALAFSLGNFPQLVRDRHPLLGGDLAALGAAPVHSAPTPGLVEWAKGAHGVQALLAAGILRLDGQLDEADALLRSADVPAPLEALRANEAAALAWHRGRAEEARASWGEQQATVPVLFNLGMASLFLRRLQDAQFCLTEAVDQLPETSAWHHLGQLYLALVASRR
jgi:tetratricopeptide (TPR) repeat protein